MTSITERTVLFADLRGSTGLYENLGNAQAAAVVTRNIGLMVQLVDHFDGRVVKTLGDGLMAVFGSPQDAVDAADEMHDAIERTAGNPPPRAKRLPTLKLQIAMSHGEVIELHGDCFGDAVNVAARLIDSAGDDETLSTEQVVRCLDEQHRGRFRSLSQLQLRGRAEPVHVLRLEAKRFGETVATLFEGTLPNPTPDSIRLAWLDVERVLSAPDMPAVLGRSAEATYVIEDSRVSRSHARIERHGGTFQISDLSYNGTFVRFLGQSEFVSLRRGSCTLHGCGVICLGAAPNDPTAPTVQFEVLTPPDTAHSGGIAVD